MTQLEHKETISKEYTSFNVANVAKGYIQIEGYKIVSGKLNIRLKQHKHTVETTIKRSDPYILHQIQRAHHLLAEALSSLKLTRTDNLNNASSVNNLILILEDVIAAVQQARENVAMTDFESELLPVADVKDVKIERIETGLENISVQSMSQQASNLSHATTMMLYGNTLNPEIIPVQESFYPVLPRDTVAQFRIEDAKLNVKLYSLNFVSYNTAATRGDLQNPNKPWFLTSKTGEVALVTEEFSTTCNLPHVNSALVTMISAFKQCVRLRDKLSIHRSYFLEKQVLKDIHY